MADTGQRLGRHVCRVSQLGRQADTPLELLLWGMGSKVGKRLLAPRHPPFPLVSAYGEWILQRPANTPAANPGQQTPPRGLLTTQGVCCG